MNPIKRNGTIELMRFLFASSIILFHAGTDLFPGLYIIGHLGDIELAFFRNGYIGVEFFFVISGLLMAKAIYKLNNSGTPITRSLGEETVSFLWKKAKPILPYYLPVCAGMVIIFVVSGADLLNILSRLPSVFFLQMTGAFDYSLLGVAWYISSMLIAMAILYPLCRRFYKTFTVLIAPLLGILIVGAIIYNTGGLGGVTDWSAVTYKSNLRALAELALGCTCFEVSRRIKQINFKLRGRILLSFVAFLCFGLSVLFIFCNIYSTFSAHVLLLFCITATIVFSGQGWISQTGIMQRKLFIYLGSLSLPLYLVQNIARFLVPSIFPDLALETLVWLDYLGALLIAVLLHLVVTGITKYRKKRFSEKLIEDIYKYDQN